MWFLLVVVEVPLKRESIVFDFLGDTAARGIADERFLEERVFLAGEGVVPVLPVPIVFFLFELRLLERVGAMMMRADKLGTWVEAEEH